MELWIRSQDKERLVKVYDVYIEGWLIRANFQGHYSGCNYVDLGEYNSKSRALEVLDEIQYLLNNNFCYSEELGRYITCNNAIYEMPKD